MGNSACSAFRPVSGPQHAAWHPNPYSGLNTSVPSASSSTAERSVSMGR